MDERSTDRNTANWAVYGGTQYLVEVEEYQVQEPMRCVPTYFMSRVPFRVLCGETVYCKLSSELTPPESGDAVSLDYSILTDSLSLSALRWSLLENMFDSRE